MSHETTLLTRKDFLRIADTIFNLKSAIIAEGKTGGLTEDKVESFFLMAIHDLEKVLAITNPRFNKSKFEERTYHGAPKISN